MNKYSLNKKAVFFHPEYDQLNDYEIPILDVNNKLILLKRNGYIILKLMGNETLSLEELVGRLVDKNYSLGREDLENFVSDMVEKGIILIHTFSKV